MDSNFAQEFRIAAGYKGSNEIVDEMEQVTLEMIEAKAGKAFKDHVEKTPKVEALLRHIITIPCAEQRYRLLMEWKHEIQYDSAHYPVEAQWYIATVLPNKEIGPGVQAWQRGGLTKYNMTMFSYLSTDDGLLRRHHISVLIDPQNAKEFRMAFEFKTAIINGGGFASVLTAPEFRWNTINVVLGKVKRSWAHYCIKLYNVQLLTDSISSGRFDPTSLDKYRIIQKRPFTLNINYISTLV